MERMQDPHSGVVVRTVKSFMSKIPSVFTGLSLIPLLSLSLCLSLCQKVKIFCCMILTFSACFLNMTSFTFVAQHFPIKGRSYNEFKIFLAYLCYFFVAGHVHKTSPYYCC